MKTLIKPSKNSRQVLPVGVPGLDAKMHAIAEKQQEHPDAQFWQTCAWKSSQLLKQTRIGQTLTGTVCQTLAAHCDDLAAVCQAIVKRRAWVGSETADWWQRQERVLRIMEGGFLTLSEQLGPEELPKQ